MEDKNVQRVHVVPRGNRWAIGKSRGGGTTSSFNTRGQAMTAAKQIALDKRVELVVHSRNGTVLETRQFTKH